MVKRTIIKNSFVVNEGKIFSADVLLEGGRISKIGVDISTAGAEVIDATGKYLFPGVIDDQVHFREPGLTHKGEIYTEAKSGVAGGITSYMEMPNTVPNTLTQELLEEKYQAASQKSLANYSFFMGASNDNLEEVLKTDPEKVCGLKIFMGSSTGNMLVDKKEVLENIFANSKMLIAAHCEDEATIRANTEKAKAEYGEDVPIEMHPVIRDEEACFKSSSFAVELARKHNARLHILHISTAKELSLFENKTPLKDKKITSEACIHHLWFTDEDYKDKGSLIKWNPAVKKQSDRDAIREAVNNGTIDVVATDHAPHTIEEKQNKYFKAPSGGPLVQHALVAMLDMYHKGVFSLEKIAEKMSHYPAILFRVRERGFIREGYWADLVLVDLNNSWRVNKENILYKCGWSPFEGHTFKSKVTHTFVNGHLVFNEGNFDETIKGQRLLFNHH
jgi:dihydroorotase